MCDFCNIANGTQNAYKVLEKETHVAFLDMGPINEGHVLIVPKLHKGTIVDIPNEILVDIFDSAKEIVIALEKTYGNRGYTIMQNGGENCDFGHFHLHVFPRYKDDGFGWTDSGVAHEYSQAVADKIAANL